MPAAPAAAVETTDNANQQGDNTRPKPKNAKLYIGQHGPSIWREGMEIGNPMRDGLGAFYFISIGILSRLYRVRC
jgi:hypothetical protein